MQTNALNKLFRPRSIAVVGASANEEKAGFQMIRALLSFTGNLYPINPKSGEVLGLKVHPDLQSIGKPVDLAIFTLPAELCLDAMQDAASAGVGAIMIISGGFAESGERGRQLQNQMITFCKKHGIRLLGPNTSGYIQTFSNITATFAPSMNVLNKGPVGIIAQSGAVNLALVALAGDQGLGVSLAAGIGNGEDVSSAEVIEYLADDNRTKVIIVYLEGVSDGRRLYNAISYATMKKPVVIFPVGRANLNEFALSHTGNLVGSFDLKVAALEQAGAVVVSSTHELIYAGSLFSRIRLEPNPNPGVALLTGQAGPAMIISDYLLTHGVSMPQLTEEIVNNISSLLPQMTFIKNPIDTGRPSDTFSDILQVISNDPGIDVIIMFVLHEPTVINPTRILTSVKGAIPQAVVFGTAGASELTTPTINSIRALNIPAFSSPDRTAQAVRILVEDSKAAFRGSSRVKHRTEPDSLEPIKSEIDEAEAKSILSAIGIPCPDHEVCSTHLQALQAFDSLPKPCVVKVLSPQIHHKAQVGGVHLNINSKEALLNSLEQIDKIDGNYEKRYLIEAMAPEGLEMIIGGINDKSFGPTVIVGLGGAAAEAIDDVSIRLAPLSLIEAKDMLNGLRSAALFDGHPGETPLDTNTLADALVRVGNFIVAHPEISEIDLNPIRVYPTGIKALDALII